MNIIVAIRLTFLWNIRSSVIQQAKPNVMGSLVVENSLKALILVLGCGEDAGVIVTDRGGAGAGAGPNLDLLLSNSLSLSNQK
jgi:hypothetical protein